MNKKISILLFVVCLVSSCRVTTDSNIDLVVLNAEFCDDFIEGLVENDNEALEVLLNPQLEQFTMQDLDNDACVHDRKLDAFNDFLNDNCPLLSSKVLCCGCIETFPTISEIKVSFELGGVEVEKTLDLVSPEQMDGVLVFGGVH